MRQSALLRMPTTDNEWRWEWKPAAAALFILVSCAGASPAPDPRAGRTEGVLTFRAGNRTDQEGTPLLNPSGTQDELGKTRDDLSGSVLRRLFLAEV